MNRDYEDEIGRSRAKSRKKTSAHDTGHVSERGRKSSLDEKAGTGHTTAKRQTEKRPVYQDGDEDDDLKVWTDTRSSQGQKNLSSNAAGRQGTQAARKRYTPPRTSQTSSRIKARSEKSKRRRRIIMMIIAECFALVFIFGYAFYMKTMGTIQRADDFKAEAVRSDLTIDTLEKMEGYWTIALFGVDSRGANVEKGTHSDVNMICNINEDTGEIKIVSVFRDSYLNIDDEGSYNKINLAYFRGGPTQAVKALNKNLDLDITDYVTFNWKAVAQGIDILGGVDIELSKAEFHYINSFISETAEATGLYTKHLTHAGMNHLDGVQAVAYGRLRLMDTDYARTERQRKILQLAFDKAKEADIGTLNQIIEVVFPNISSSMTAPDFIRVAQKITKYHLGETGGFPFARGDVNMGKKGACVIPQTLEGNVTELHQFLFGDENYVPTDSVKKISAKISNDSGLYNQGKSIGHVSTEGGVITTPKKTEAASNTKSETKETKETKEAEVVEGGIDLDGDGEPDIDYNDEEFWDDPSNWPTDEDGNPVHPGMLESSSRDNHGEEPGSSTVRPGGTGSSRPDESSASRPGGTSSRPDGTSAAHPGGTSSTRPDGTSAARPGGTGTSQPSRTDPAESSSGNSTGNSSPSRPSTAVTGTAGVGNGPGGAGSDTSVNAPGGGPGDNSPSGGSHVAPAPVGGGGGNSSPGGPDAPGGPMSPGDNSMDGPN
ncbi:LCP family protein [Lachnospiraceae bacterium 62-35]